MIEFLKKVLPESIKKLIRGFIPKYFTNENVLRIWNKKDIEDWPKQSTEGIKKYEYSVFSQNGEDGILRYIYSEIGFKSKVFLEFGFGTTENNSLRLMLKEGFGGVFIDGSDQTVDSFNKSAKTLNINNVQAISRFLTLKNLKSVILDSGLPNEIDLLSIDVDGNDFWFWKDITYLSPRVVIVEYNASLGPDVSLSTIYDDSFLRHEKHDSGMYCSASLTAFTKLAKEKGYSLITCDSAGVNAFFVRNDCLTENLKVSTPEEAFYPHKNRINRGLSLEDQFNTIKDMPYIEI